MSNIDRLTHSVMRCVKSSQTGWFWDAFREIREKNP